jgi:hypothetical protein
MPQSSGAAIVTEREGHDRSVDAGDLFEQMLEAEIMGSGAYGADPDLDLIEERLSQLRQGAETSPRPPEPAPEALPDLDFELDLEAEPVSDIAPAPQEQPAGAIEPVPDTAPEDLLARATPPVAPPVAARPAAPPVVVAGNRPANLSRPATSADAVVLEAARAAGVSPPYRGAAGNSTPRTAPPAPMRRTSQLPSFYVAVLMLLLASFAFFAVWRTAPADMGAMSLERAGTVAEVVPAMPSLPILPTSDGAPVDPQTTASVSDLSSRVAPELATAKPGPGYAPRRIVKLYRVDAEGNIIGYTPAP